MEMDIDDLRQRPLRRVISDVLRQAYLDRGIRLGCEFSPKPEEMPELT